MSGLSRETRLQIMLDDDELAAIDEWRFKQHMPSRAAAVRELLKIGLRAETKVLADPRQRSEEFGVITRGNKRK
jgi:hypothetical protein